MTIPDLRIRAALHLASVYRGLEILPSDRLLMPEDTQPILTKARTALASIQYLHDLVCGQKPAPPLGK